MKPRHLLPLAALSLSAALPSPAQEPVPLFDGRSLGGWDFTPGFWRVEDGTVAAGTGKDKIPRNEFISTKKSYANFELTLKIQCAGDPATGMINSGIQIRSARLPGGGMAGYQVDCGAGWFGKIYDEHRRALIYGTPVDPAALEKAVDVFGWNEYRILAEGPRLQVWINGVKASDYTEVDPDIPLNGSIAPQIHGGGHAIVRFKDISIRELPDTPGAPTWESLGGVEAALKKVKTPEKAPAKAKGKGVPQAAKPMKEGNAVAGAARSAAEQLKAFHLPEGYEIELVVQESEGVGKFISVYFDQRGRLWTQTALEYPVDGNENPAAAEALYRGKGRDKILVYPRESLAELPDGGLGNPAVFADGLAIPLGILPWGAGDSCYAMHGPDLVLLRDTDGDGRSDQREILLTGFGVQDSHLFPHQFTRAPGDWIWMAQGLFNQSAVRRPGSEESVDFPQCSMARMRPDGGGFEVTSTGPNNIWGLILTGEGEAFIQEANDYGYPVMPFHDYAYYPGGMARHKRSYQPDFPPTAPFRLGGTGLSGLALLESGPGRVADADLTVLVANPITTKLNAIAMRRDKDDWKLEQLADFVSCDDPFFRPVALTQGPDGALYLVDWYNKIISHNEVPRNHPDRDKTRGRIWRIKEKGGSTAVPDFTALPTPDLIALLGKAPAARAHLAAQTLIDRKDPAATAPLQAALTDPQSPDALRVQALWILPGDARAAARPLVASANRNVRRELARLPEFAPDLAADRDREVRAAVILTLARRIGEDPAVLPQLLDLVEPALREPSAPGSRGGDILVASAYDRAYQRFLIRRFLESHRPAVAAFLDSPGAGKLSPEARVLATLALGTEEGATRLSTLLPSLDRAPEEEEILLLANGAGARACAAALEAMLLAPRTSAPVVATLLKHQAALDAAKIGPLLATTASSLLDQGQVATAARLGGVFRIAALEPRLVAALEGAAAPDALALLEALRLLRSDAVAPLAELAASPDRALRDAAIAALAESRSPEAGPRLVALHDTLSPSQQRALLAQLAGKKQGAALVVEALLDGSLPQAALDGPVAERLSAVLGDSPKLARLMEAMGGVFQEILVLDGSAEAWTGTGLDLAGPFTLESWVRLDPGIGNEDALLGSPGQLSVNFFDGRFRYYIQGRGDLAISEKPMTPGLWTHLALARDEKGALTLYHNGEPDAAGRQTSTETLGQVRVGWSPVARGTGGAFAETRIWNRARTPAEIRASFDRAFPGDSPPEGLVHRLGSSPAQPAAGARTARTIEGPPLLGPEQAARLDADFARLEALGRRGGDVEKGKALAALCTACHLIGGQGGQIGPDLSGVGSMGLEAILRNLLTPNAAMEAGYRIYRVEMKNGDLVDAFFVSEDEEAVVVRQPGVAAPGAAAPGAADRRIPRGEIESTRFIRRSLMPEGLLSGLDDASAANLLAYLLSLK